MTKDFQKMNIPKLPVFTTEEGIKRIKEFFGKLIEWKNIDDLIPINFKKDIKYKKTGKAGIFAGSLELVKEGNISIKQKNLFDEIHFITLTENDIDVDISIIKLYYSSNHLNIVSLYFSFHLSLPS